LKNKLTDLQFLLTSELSDIVSDTDTWLTCEFFVTVVFVSDLPYSVYQSDRHTSQGGGVCILTRDESTKSLLVLVFINSEAIELVVIDVLNQDAPSRIVTVHRPRPPSRIFWTVAAG